VTTWDPPALKSGQYPPGHMFEMLVDQVDKLTTSWRSYVPTWGTDGTAPALGNGALTASYRWPTSSDLVHVKINWQAGSTTTFGTTNWHFSLPVTANTADKLVGCVHLGDAGTTRLPGVTINKSTTQMYVVSPSGPVTPTVPFTWANGDTLDIDVWYQPA
jgi:hypothetical protein